MSTLAEIISRAMEKKSETKVFDCLFRKSKLLMKLQDFLYPAYPSQKDFLATQTKLQITLGPFPDLKRLSMLFTQLQVFKGRLKNQIISESRAAQLLSKFFQEDFKKIKGVLKDFSISKQLLQGMHKKKYAAPGTEDLVSNVYSYFLNFLSYSYKTSPNAELQSTMHPEFANSKYRENPNLAGGNNTYYGNRDHGMNKRSAATMNYSQPRNPIASLKNAGKVDIEKRIHLDNLKKHLSNKFEKETSF